MAAAAPLAPLALVALAPLAGWLLHRVAGRLAEGGMPPPRLAVQGLAVAVAVWAAVALPPAMAAPGCLLGWCLVALAATDLAAFLLPDALTLPLAGAGLLLAEGEVLADCVAGAVAGWAAFQAIGWSYRRLRGRDGLGGGDAKLMTAAGAWVGWQGLPTVVVVAAALGLAWATASAVLRRRPLDAAARLPFGPFLCLGLWFTWSVGPIHVA